METVTLSPKFQVVIPKRVREHLGLKPGQKLEVVQIGLRIELVAQQPACALRGLLRGIDATAPREPDRLCASCCRFIGLAGVFRRRTKRRALRAHH
ncbi:AbrB/MazE/SpoVT family DNA-binding domain-containing protein [Thiomonas arsenitoxydans]|uniref:AbrB/MazE/SpoVT family DNA-binding domain-containing protein n=1 Tax=Thiomonas arsenitoxydans (strain DSM 22701 / CIP 110005 / 3As) TaxID=426114 RepID=UPI001AC5FE00|nr:AbrB/MazE/SpoVT family DNA-binding domain-containing protein [Thiomonas arsenitoxydans]MBN8777122.1 AbrB/MazE/SpoVT family DNA-binding domain-containing protein [Thiomonas arsenitoxydans]